jgi:hypothetical protein
MRKNTHVPTHTESAKRGLSKRRMRRKIPRMKGINFSGFIRESMSFWDFSHRKRERNF